MVTARGRRALAVVRRAGVLDALATYDPVIVGTFPLGLDREGSDVDVLCHADDLQGFVDNATRAFGDHQPVSSHRFVPRDGHEAAVVRFAVDDVPVEVFAQPVPTTEQHGFRHLQVERRLLDLGGERLAARLRANRAPGASVEAAFAEVLGLPGDPFEAVLSLERAPTARLDVLVADVLGDP